MSEDDSLEKIPGPADERSVHNKYRLVELREDFKLVQIPDDPLEALRSAASEEFESVSVMELQDFEPQVRYEETDSK
ncbi:hypothetical protein [Halorussus pelagicus]|uniref:hypothetical protein n=1 Tax=Halorussus pelagicus TaxID=2505977 RepID=UPI001AA077F0|nr:hypothetical protein [Halorussus pelagicus]